MKAEWRILKRACELPDGHPCRLTVNAAGTSYHLSSSSVTSLLVYGLGIFGCSLFLAVILTSLMKTAGPKIGLIDQPGTRRVHAKPTPKGGGLALFAATLAPVIGGYLLVLVYRSNPENLPEIIRNEVSNIQVRSRTVLFIFTGGAVMVALGIIDDLKGLTVGVRFGVEALVAAGLFFLAEEVRVTFFSPFPLTWLGMTVLWIVGITNSFNLLDNMDGLSAGVSLIVSVALLIVAVLTQQFLVAALLVAFIGALLGFLFFNFPPASIFMGDSGSLFLGYFLAVLTTLCTFASYHKGNILAAAVPLLILAVPLYDTATVVWIRVRNRKPIFEGDKNHLSHRLVALGFSQRDAVLTIYLLTFCCAAGAILVIQLDQIGGWIVLFQVFGFLLLTAFLERAGRKVVQKSSANNQAETAGKPTAETPSETDE